MKKLLLLILLLSSNAYALTTGQIIARARANIQDQALDRDYQIVSDNMMLQYLNDGQREANAIGWLLQSSTTISVTAGTTEYALPTDFMGTQFVLFKNVKIDQTSLNELNATVTGWKTATGTPIKYYIYLTGTPVIGFYPAPNSGGTGTAIVYYVQQPTELTTTSQTPFNSWNILTPYHSGLIYYVTYRSWMALGKPDLAAPYANDWNIFLQNIKTGVMRQPDFNPGLAGKRN